MKTFECKLKGMSCYTSENRIKTGLGYLDGMKEITSNCQTHLFYCTYDENIVTKNEIIAYLKEMEFDIDE